MASVTLTHTWLAPLADLSDGLALLTSNRTDERGKAGEVRAYAGGRLRVIARSGSRQSLGVTARMVDAATLAKLESWTGSVLLLRDPWGRKVYGTFLGMTVRDYTDRSGHDVTFTFQQVTASEAV